MEILTPYQGKNVIIDATVLSSLMSCGRFTDLRFNHSFESVGGKSVSLEMGSIVHTFLEFYYKAIINGMNKSAAAGHGMAAATEYINTDVNNSTDADKALALSTCEQYLDYWKNDSWVPLEIETVHSKQLYMDDEVRIIWKAKYDYLGDSNNGIYPMDHKTMKQRRDTINLNNQFTGQCILAGTRTMFVNKIGFQTSLKPAEKFMRVPVNYTYDRLTEWQEEILPYWVKMMLMYEESGYWPPNFTHCENKFGFCQFKGVCEQDRNMRESELGMNFVVGKIWDPTND